MRILVKHIAGMLLILWSVSSQAMTIWVVESGQDPFLNSQDTLVLSAGTNTLDLYYDVGSDISYGYDFILSIIGSGSITNVGGGDSELGDVYGNGWRQFGGSIFGETGSSVLGFSFDLIADPGASLLISGSYTNLDFNDELIVPSTLATVVPVPAAVWLFGSGIIALGAFTKRRKV